MRPVLAFRHTPHEPLGLLVQTLEEAQLPFSYLDLFAETPRKFDPRFLSGLIVLGGPMSVDDVDAHRFLLHEPEWIRLAVAHGVPVLGLCLGAQLISKALGGVVFRAKRPELGWHPIRLTHAASDDRLFRGLPRDFEVVQWRQDTFSLPPQALLLARSRALEYQAFRFGDTTYGLQFHLEATEPMIQDWLNSVSAEEAELWSAGERARCLYETPEKIAHYNELGLSVFRRFVDLCTARSSP